MTVFWKNTSSFSHRLPLPVPLPWSFSSSLSCVRLSLMGIRTGVASGKNLANRLKMSDSSARALAWLGTKILDPGESEPPSLPSSRFGRSAGRLVFALTPFRNARCSPKLEGHVLANKPLIRKQLTKPLQPQNSALACCRPISSQNEIFVSESVARNRDRNKLLTNSPGSNSYWVTMSY